MLTTSIAQTHAVRFDDLRDARSFVRAIRRRGWEARRQGNIVYVVIGMRASLDLMVKQWAVISGRTAAYDGYTIVE